MQYNERKEMQKHTRINWDWLLALAREGRTMPEIIEETGYTERQVSQTLYKMRAKGLDVPYLNRTGTLPPELETEKQGYCALPRHRRGNLEPLTVRIDSNILQHLKRTARLLGISQAELVERSFQKWIELKGIK